MESSLTASTVAALRALYEDRHDDPLLQGTLRETIHALESLTRTTEAVTTRYMTLIDAVPDAVTVHDEDGRILTANAAARDIFGYSLEELRRMSVHDLNPDLPPHHMRNIWSSFGDGESLTHLTTNRRVDGTVFPVEVHSNGYMDDGCKRIVAVARDISARTEAEHELRASEARYRHLLHSMDKGVLVQDQEGHIVSCNPAACRILGLSERELITLRRRTLKGWRFVDELGRAMDFKDLPGNRALIHGKTVGSTIFGVYLPHRHLYRWLSASAVPYLDESNAPSQVISTFSDVSELMRQAEMFESMQRIAAIGGWELDDLRGSLFWTREMYRIHDLPVNSAISESRMLGFLPPRERARLAHALRRARERADDFDLELQITTTLGRARWVRMRGQPLLRHERIYGVAGTLQDITERKRVQQQLERRASTDPLTGLDNRNATLEKLEQRLAQGDAAGGFCVLYVDFDRFKVANEMLGHESADRLMQSASQRLSKAVAGLAEIGRMGGDEFLLTCEDDDDQPCGEGLAQRIVQTFAAPFQHGDSEISLSVSIGVAHCPEDGIASQQLINHADAAMLDAKRRGRNTWQTFGPQLAEQMNSRMQIETLLRRAMDKDELRLEYQPQMDLRQRSVCGVEALLRWRNKQLGEVDTERFVRLAEQSGDIVQIGRWVVREACRQLRQWHTEGVEIDRVAVNISYRQVLSGSLVETVDQALREHQLSGESLELELTERMLIEDVRDTRETLTALKRLGVMLSIDDFGEGYSSLNYLRRLPIDSLKISHSFISGVPGNRADSMICEAIARIARSLDLAVTAEGVETDAQFQFVQGLDVVAMQGFLFSRPLPAQDVPAFVRSHKRGDT